MPKTARPYVPYTYKLILVHNDIRYTYLGCRTSSDPSSLANPYELREGYTPKVKRIKTLLEDGGMVLSRQVLQRFEGSAQGAIEAVEYTNELLKFLNAAKEVTYLNSRNFVTSPKTFTKEYKNTKSKQVKDFYATSEGKSKRAKQSKDKIDYWSNEDNRIEQSNKMRGQHKGKKHPRHLPFELVATLPNGDTQTHTFDGQTPSRDCVKFGVPGHKQAQLKRGETITIKNRINKTTHPFPVGTILSINTLNK